VWIFFKWRQWVSEGSYFTHAGIDEFAQAVGIAPGIAVGRLQHEGLLAEDNFNELKRHLEWNECK
jgi:HTH-type transcriptional regulator / antitoxin HigA